MILAGICRKHGIPTTTLHDNIERTDRIVQWKENMPWLEIFSLVNLEGTDRIVQWTENIPWLEISSLVVAGIAVLIAAGSLLTSRRAHNISEIQALPRVSLVRTWSGREGRDLYINLEQISDRPDWVVASVSVRRTWWNWRERRFLARGEVEDHVEYISWDTLPSSRRTGNWERRITYEPPIREAAIFLHPDAPNCEVTLEITLTTSPSPTIKRHIKSLKESPARRLRQNVIE